MSSASPCHPRGTPPSERESWSSTPEPDLVTVLTASLYNHGLTVTTRAGSVRISPHVTTQEESYAMLRSAFMSFATV